MAERKLIFMLNLMLLENLLRVENYKTNIGDSKISFGFRGIGIFPY